MTVRRFPILLCCAAALLSCSEKEPEEKPVDELVSVNAASEEFVATAASSGTRVLWTAGDRIAIYSSSGTKGVLTLSGKGGSGTATFEGKMKDTSTPLYAYHPAIGARGLSEGKLSFVLPQSRDGIAGGFSAEANPSVAVYTSLSETPVFRNLAGLLRLTLLGSGSVSKAALESLDPSEQLWGNGLVNTSGSGAEWTPVISGGDNVIYLEFPDALSLSRSAGTDIFFTLPAGTLGSGFRISLYDGGGTLVDALEFPGNHSISRSGITAATFSGVDSFTGMTIPGTLIRTSTADPCLLYRDGEFWLTMTGSTRIALVHDSDLGRLTTSAHPSGSNIVYDSASDPAVTALYGSGAAIEGTWSPEIHLISAQDCPGYEGCYMFFALKQKLDDARNVRSVILKSSSGSIAGPYCNPLTLVRGSSQPLLDKNGNPVSEWNIGMSLLKIPSGAYKGLYGTFVDEVGRGTGVQGKFYQRIRIAKLKSPWQLSSDLYTVTTPTQEWEKAGSSNTLPEVVEGGTAVYGDNGEIFLVYCGGGYWSDYGLGQMTLKRENGDYCNPLLSDSWVKCDTQPLFTARESSDLRGAGHAFFLKDDKGNRFFAYHAYPWDGTSKASSRNAYLEPYFIDASVHTADAPDGLIRFGAAGNGKTAPTSTSVTFHTRER